MIRSLIIIISVLTFTRCNQANQKYDKPYFDFDSLIAVQERALVDRHTTLNKKVMLDGEGDSSTQQLDSVIIAHELDVFRQLDIINKPLYSKTYKITDGEKDKQSNLFKRQYIALVPSPVPFITFYYQGTPDQLRKIESFYQESNTLYSTQRKLTLEFEGSTGGLLLSRYKLAGGQKMILTDTVQFSIEGILH